MVIYKGVEVARFVLIFVLSFNIQGNQAHLTSFELKL